MNTFLRLRHWQVFSIVFVLPIAIGVLAPMFWYLLPAETAYLYLPFLQVIPIALLAIWFLAVGEFLARALAKTRVEVSNSWFKFCLFLVVFLGLAVAGAFYTFDIAEFLMMLLMLNVLVSLAMLYVVYHTARLLVSLEHGQIVGISYYIGEIVLLMLWPIGIWWLQPRINKLVELFAGK